MAAPGIVPPRDPGVNQEPYVPDADQLSEEQKAFQVDYQKNAGEPSRLRAEHARESAWGEPTPAEAREAQRAEAGMGPSFYEQKDFQQDVDPSKAAKAQQPAEQAAVERGAAPAGDASNPYGALPADETA